MKSMSPLEALKKDLLNFDFSNARSGVIFFILYRFTGHGM